MKTTRIGVDLAKSVFEVAVSRRPGKVRERHRLSRARFHRFLAQHESSEVLLEACSSAHHWGREIQAMGHTVSLLHPADVARYRDGETPGSQELDQLGLGQSRVPEYRAERALRDLLVIRDRDPAERLGSLAENDMAPLLPIDHVP